MADSDYQNFNDERLPINIEDEMRKSYQIGRASCRERV